MTERCHPGNCIVGIYLDPDDYHAAPELVSLPQALDLHDQLYETFKHCPSCGSTEDSTALNTIRPVQCSSCHAYMPPPAMDTGHRRFLNFMQLPPLCIPCLEEKVKGWLNDPPHLHTRYPEWELLKCMKRYGTIRDYYRFRPQKENHAP